MAMDMIYNLKLVSIIGEVSLLLYTLQYCDKTVHLLVQLNLLVLQKMELSKSGDPVLDQ